jgi:hypothetical protein
MIQEQRPVTASTANVIYWSLFDPNLVDTSFLPNLRLSKRELPKVNRFFATFLCAILPCALVLCGWSGFAQTPAGAEDAAIRPEGKIILPRYGDLPAANLTSEQRQQTGAA